MCLRSLGGLNSRLANLFPAPARPAPPRDLLWHICVGRRFPHRRAELPPSPDQSGIWWLSPLRGPPPLGSSRPPESSVVQGTRPTARPSHSGAPARRPPLHLASVRQVRIGRFRRPHPFEPRHLPARPQGHPESPEGAKARQRRSAASVAQRPRPRRTRSEDLALVQIVPAQQLLQYPRQFQKPFGLFLFSDVSKSALQLHIPIVRPIVRPAIPVHRRTHPLALSQRH